MRLINDIFNKILIIVGPTAVGKSDYAVHLALLYNAEIINCDMMQVFSYGSIGTGHIALVDRIGINHHLIGFWDLPESFSVYQMRLKIEEKINEISSRGKRIIVVGGSYFCVMALFFLPYRFYRINYQKNKNVGNEGVVFDNVVFNNSHKNMDKIVFYPSFDYALLEVDIQDRDKWRKYCFDRVEKFIKQGLLMDYKKLPEVWKQLFIRKKIIGYYEAYLFEEKLLSRIEDYKLKVFYATCQYGKKQRTFGRKLYRDLSLYGIIYKRYVW